MIGLPTGVPYTINGLSRCVRERKVPTLMMTTTASTIYVDVKVAKVLIFITRLAGVAILDIGARASLPCARSSNR